MLNEFNQVQSENKGIAPKLDDTNLRLQKSETALEKTRNALLNSQESLSELVSQNTKLAAKSTKTRIETTTHRYTSNPEKFTGLKKGVIKRQDQYLSWKSEINLNFVQDEVYFDNEKVKILTILRCSGCDAYRLNRDIIEQVQQNKDEPSA
ncbi:hypothetical protein K3495_g5364 [Podosphaera aphanis]|nr:hypothetical protein K3495_g5364 [Podosphaera aphanis]